MKTMKVFLIAFVCMLSQSLICCADDQPIPVQKLPAAAKTFVEKTFPGKKILYAEKDNEFGGAKYEVHLNDGTELSFDKKGNWDKVDCKMTAVPAQLIPAAIAQYVKANFPDDVITKIDKERYGYDVELRSDLELKFNKSGELIGMDD